MNISTAEEVILKFENYFRAKFILVANKRVIYNGSSPDFGSIMICTPYAKLQSKGYWWVDINAKQIALMEDADIALFAFRLEGGVVYYVKFMDLIPFLSKKYIIYNKNEGDHWKLKIWPDYIIIQGNDNVQRSISKNINDLVTK